jgi:hypothetical protein
MSIAERGAERGSATILALLVMMLLGAIGAGLVILTTTETLIGAAYRHAQEAAHGAEAATERALHDLASTADWSAVLSAPPANSTSTFDDGASAPRGPDGRVLDLATMTAGRQRESDARAGPAVFGADTPQWRLFGHAPIADLLPSAEMALPVYLVIWVADDGLDGDGEPARDTNGRLLVHAVAVGSGGARRSVEASIARSAGGVLHVLAWHRVP